MSAMDEVAVIQPFIDIAQLARSIARGLLEYNDGERALQAAERKTEGMRQEQQRRRLELGRMLIEAKRGIKHGGWLPYLEKLGIAERTARVWMQEAGYVDSKSAAGPDAADINPRIAAGIDKRPRKRDEETDPPPAHDDDRRAASHRSEQAEEPNLFASWKRDISRALVGLDKMIMGYAKSWPKRSRADLARTLRSVAERIERMTDE